LGKRKECDGYAQGMLGAAHPAHDGARTG
jgi:hypothetical protein